MPRHGGMNEHTHVQDFQVRRATGEATAGNAGERLIEGKTERFTRKATYEPMSALPQICLLVTHSPFMRFSARL